MTSNSLTNVAPDPCVHCVQKATLKTLHQPCTLEHLPQTAKWLHWLQPSQPHSHISKEEADFFPASPPVCKERLSWRSLCLLSQPHAPAKTRHWPGEQAHPAWSRGLSQALGGGAQVVVAAPAQQFRGGTRLEGLLPSLKNGKPQPCLAVLLPRRWGGGTHSPRVVSMHILTLSCACCCGLQWSPHQFGSPSALVLGNAMPRHRELPTCSSHTFVQKVHSLSYPGLSSVSAERVVGAFCDSFWPGRH